MCSWGVGGGAVTDPNEGWQGRVERSLLKVGP